MKRNLKKVERFFDKFGNVAGYVKKDNMPPRLPERRAQVKANFERDRVFYRFWRSSCRCLA